MEIKNLAVATIVTEKTFKEFKLMKYSLEKFHDVCWYISCDEYVQEKLALDNQFDGVCEILVETDDADHNIASEEQKDNWAKLMFTKFDICELALKSHNPYVLFLDCDMVFVNPIQENVWDLLHEPNIDAMISPHMTNNPQVEAKHGYYNAGMFVARNLDFIETWKDLSESYKELNMYFEQQPLEFVHRGFVTVNLPINYNIGWWRFNSKQTQSRLSQVKLDNGILYFGRNPAINFHMHALKDLHYENYGQFLVDHVMNLLSQSNNDDYQDIYKKYLELAGE